MSDHAGWKNYRLGEVAPAKQPKFPADHIETWNLGLEDIEAGTGAILRRLRDTVSNLGPSKVAFDKTNVLYGKLRPYLRKVVVPDEAGVATSELIPLQPDPTKLDRNFLFYYLLGPSFTEFANKHTQGANLPRVAMAEFWKHDLFAPNITEQRRIVARIQDCFSRLEEMEQLQASVKTDATNLLASTLRQCFESLTNAPQSSLEEVTIESKYGTNAKCHEHLQGIPILRIPNVAQGVISIEKLKFTLLPPKELEKVRLSNGDLLIVRTNGSPELVGRCAVFDQPGDYGYASYLIRFRLDTKRVRPHFVSLYLQSPQGREAISKIRQTSAGQFNINSENLRAITLPVPSLVEQDQVIGLSLRTQEAAKEIGSENSSTTSDLSHLRTAILREAFAGRL